MGRERGQSGEEGDRAELWLGTFSKLRVRVLSDKIENTLQVLKAVFCDFI